MHEETGESSWTAPKPAAGGKEAPARRKYRPFSEEEVAALIQGVRRHGQGNWTKIHDDVDLPFMVRS